MKQNCLKNCLSSKNGISFPYWPKDYLRIPTLFQLADFATPYNLLSSKKKERYVPVCVWYSLISSYSLLIFVLRFKSQTIKKKKVIKKIFIHNPYSILEKYFVLHFKSQTIRKKKVLITVDPQPVFNFGEHIWKERILFVYIKKNPPTHPPTHPHIEKCDKIRDPLEEFFNELSFGE